MCELNVDVGTNPGLSEGSCSETETTKQTPHTRCFHRSSVIATARYEAGSKLSTYRKSLIETQTSKFIHHATKFITAFKTALDREDEVNLTDEFREYVEWDSLAYLEVIAMLDEDFKKLKTVEDLLEEVKRRKE